MAANNRQLVRKWAVDFGDGPSTSRPVPDPLGYSRNAADQDDGAAKSKSKELQDSSFKQKKAWEVATSPFKNILMMGFMMWMSGATIQIFSIMMTFSGMWQPIQSIRNSGQVFNPLKDKNVDIALPRLVFCAVNLLGCGIAMWKLNQLGLLPTSASDLTSSLPVPPTVEFAGGGEPYL